MFRVMGVTIHDIAKAVGVSPSTVSRALSGKGRISAATRERIRKVAEEMGYRPNMLARGLATNTTGAIGVVIHRRHMPVEKSFYGVILEAIEREVSEHGYHVVFSTLRDHDLPRCVRERRVDGLILLGTDVDKAILEPLREKLPIVLVDHHVTGLASVVGDNVGGGVLATQHLIDHGHRKIAFIVETFGDPNFRARFVGYRRALERNGLRTDENLVLETNWQGGFRYSDVEKLFRGRNPPTAVFAANDYMAVGTIMALLKMGLRVPHDVAVVGFDDASWATIVDPPLTSVHVPRVEMGKAAARKLLEMLSGTERNEDLVLLRTTLTRRGSCGCNAVKGPQG
ncbi:LacI family DNA-binding transcriptional regulator [Candidatus Bipolaricaulota sp. J31]